VTFKVGKSKLVVHGMQRTTILALAIRVLIALSTRTFFQPDEFFQSLEPAHHLVFGYGKLTWEWLTPHPIRSILYPALNVPFYWLIKVLGIDWDWLLVSEWFIVTELLLNSVFLIEG
jgi:phosphatidylinositol glycan class B